MGKKKFYPSKFNRGWLEDPELQIWIQPSREEGQTAYCPFCDRHLMGSKTLMQRHGNNPKHQRNVRLGTNKNIGSPLILLESSVNNAPKQAKVKVEVNTQKVQSNSKVPKKVSFPQKWLTDPELNNYLIPSTDPNFKAHCKFCKCGINGKRSDMLKHALTPHHIREYHLLGESEVAIPPQDLRESHNTSEESFMRLDNSESAKVDYDSEVLAQISKEMGCKIIKLEPNEVQQTDLDEEDLDEEEDDDDDG
uniref:Uncharacterized protein n=1 Tax=Cacopsylla melanoneura TaxID=428564 RepID=A0A8D8Z1G9_9HEMI